MKTIIKLFKKLFKYSFWIWVVCAISIFAADLTIQKSTQDQVYSNLQEIPHNKVGLVLGTSKYTTFGNINLYYKYRINAAVELYKAGKIDYILISGDNSTKSYDEPTTFKKDLIKRGIPANRIVLDYAGFRTLDSVVRCKEVFGETNITFISQPFHNERAVFIANHKDMKAVAYNAKDVSTRYGLRVLVREKLARVKTFIDLIFGVEPKFLGDPIRIG